MATESVKIKIDAENKASAELRKVAFDADKAAKEIKEVGGKAKASTELVGSLANSLGGTQFGGAAGEVAMLTERISAFSEVSKQGGAGAMAFKAGLVAAAAVISFKVGKAIGDVIFQTDKWNKKLEEAHQTAIRLSGTLDTMSLAGVSQANDEAIEQGPEAIQKRLATINRELGGIGQQSESAKRQLREIDESWTIFYGREDQELRLNSAVKRGTELTAERIRLIKALTGASKSDERNQTALAQLGLKLEKARAKSFEELTRIELREMGVKKESMDLAIMLITERKIIEEQAAKAEKEAKDAAIEAEKKLAEAQKQRIKQQKDGLKSQIEGDKEMVKRLQAQAAALKQRDRSSLAGPLQAGSDQRGITGKAGAEFRKTAAVIEAERQTKLQSQLKTNADQQLAILKSIERKQQQLEVIGD